MTKTNRVTAVDALRGFAVVAIMLLHFIEHFIYGVYPKAGSETAKLINQSDLFQRWTGSLRFYGRMSLTNYVSQSVIATNT